jgi:ketosteroid isomerase-like protein
MGNGSTGGNVSIKILFAVAAALALATQPRSQAATREPAQIVADHVRAAKAGDISAVIADYADDAVVVTPPGMASPSGVYSRKAQVREFFAWLTSPPNLPGVKTMETSTEMVAPDVIIMRWIQFKGTQKEVDGRDVFVIRRGKIVFQSVEPKQ